MTTHDKEAFVTSLVNKVSLAVFALLLGTQLTTAQQLVTYFHNDAAGSPVAATDANGNVVWREDYLPYGERRTYDLSGGSNRSWFTGQPHSDEYGLTYLGARYYDPVVGRFMGVDPHPVTAPYLLGFNRFAYSSNNPLRYSDTGGQETGIAFRVLYLAEGGRPSPPPRSPDDWLGPAIGGTMLVVFAPVAAYGLWELGIAAVANPATTLSLTEAILAGEALGPGTLAVTGALAAKTIDALVASANRPIALNGLSRAAQKLSSHAQRMGGTFPQPTGSVAQQNAQAENVLREILESSEATRTRLSRGGFDVRLPNGRGARFNADGSFDTFLDPKR